MPSQADEARDFLVGALYSDLEKIETGYKRAAEAAGITPIPAAKFEIAFWLNAVSLIETYGHANSENAAYLDQVFTEACAKSEIFAGLVARRVYYWEASAALKRESTDPLKYWVQMTWRLAHQILSQADPLMVVQALGPEAWRNPSLIAPAPPGTG